MLDPMSAVVLVRLKVVKPYRGHVNKCLIRYIPCLISAKITSVPRVHGGHFRENDNFNLFE